MAPIRIAAAIAFASLLQVGCDAADPPTAPTSLPSQASASRHDNGALVKLNDDCDPASFNAILGDGACVGTGSTTFDEFIAELTKHRSVNAWKFQPGTANLSVGEMLTAINLGGETHTFTEVDEFGGGIVPQLNDLAGTPVPAPECLALDPDEFLAPGASDSEVEDAAGTELYQCCIHPWMRAVIHVHKK